MRRVGALLLTTLLLLPACRDRDSRSGDAGRTDGPAQPAADASGRADGTQERPDDVVLASDSEATATGDLEAMRERGILRVLVAGAEEDFLPRQGMPSSQDRSLAREFAQRHALQVRFILVSDHDRLLELLRAGRGDVVAAQLTVTPARAKEVAFTRPLHTVDEIVVAARSAKSPPDGPEALAGQEVHVRASSSYAETLAALPEDRRPEIVAVPEHLDAEAIVYAVTRGERPLTVVDSHLLAAIEAYNPDVKRLFPVARGRQIAWAVRKDAPKLESALNAFLMEKVLTGHTDERFAGDLAGIKARGVLRVLTRNNPVTYYLHRGRQQGFDYELARMAADELGVRLEMVVPPSRDLLIPWLLEGRGDVIAASMTVTPARAKLVAFSRPYLHVEEVLVQPAEAEPLTGPDGLSGRAVHVRPSSSYRRSLAALQEAVPDLKIIEVAERLETEELVAGVAEGTIPLTVADSHILLTELKFRSDVKAAFALSGDDDWAELNSGTKEIAFGLRPDAPELRAFFDGFVERTWRGLEYNMARTRYFDNSRRIARVKAERAGTAGVLSPYDPLIKKYASKHGLDWRLMAALAYQESRFDPEAKSWVGAVGLFQVMPATAKDIGFQSLKSPDAQVEAGIRYLARLIDRLDPKIPLKQRIRFAMAAYNAGLGHVADARRLATELGLDPDRWFGNVEKAMLLLEKPRYYRKARYGYCRGSEPVKYVSEIQNRYDNWVNLVKN